MNAIDLMLTIGTFAASLPATLLIQAGCQRSNDIHGGREAPRIELLGVTVLGAYLAFGFKAEPLMILPLLGLTLTLISLSIIDWCQLRIPNRLIKPSFGLSIIGLTLVQVLGTEGSIQRGAAGAAGLAGVLGLLHLVQPSGMGRGDVRLGALLGLYVGFLSTGYLDGAWRLGIVLLASSVLGLVLALFQQILRHLAGATSGGGWRRDSPLRSRHVPFGPALSLAAMAVIFAQV